MEEKFDLGKLFEALREASYFENPSKEEIKDEWKFVCVEKLTEPKSCMCGHSPIFNACWMVNKHDPSKEIMVGNVCVNKFFDQDFSFLFKDISKLEEDLNQNISEKTADYLYEKKLINQWVFNFITGKKSINGPRREYAGKKDGILGKKNLSKKVKEIREKENKKILYKLKTSAKILIKNSHYDDE